MKKQLQIGDRVCMLRDYNLERGTVKKINTKSITVTMNAAGGFVAADVRVKPEKVCHEDDVVCVVWERWSCARGTYRLEYVKYPTKHRYARNIARQGDWVWEETK
jgi:hypothetical protein